MNPQSQFLPQPHGVDNWEGYSDALFNPENDTPISEYNTQTIIEEYWRA